MMTRETAFKYLLLLSLLGVTSADLSLSLRKSVMRQASKREDHNMYAFVRISRAPNSSLDMTIDIAIQQSSQSPKFRCSTELYATPNAIISYVGAIKWWDDSTIALTRNEEFENKDSFWFNSYGSDLLWINVTNCHISSSQPQTPIVTGEDANGKLIVVTSSNQSCDNHEWCTRILSPFLYKNLKPLGFDWPWHGSHVEAITANRFLVRYLDTEGTFKVRLYNSDEEYKELLSLRDATDIDVVSLNLTICLVHHPSEDNVATCYHFNESGDLEFSNNVYYPEHVLLSSIITLSDKGLLIARSIDNCQSTGSKDCKNVYVSLFSRYQEHTKLKCVNPTLFKCFRNTTQLAAFDVVIEDLTTLSFTSLCDYDTHYEVVQSSCHVFRDESTVAIARSKLSPPDYKYIKLMMSKL